MMTTNTSQGNDSFVFNESDPLMVFKDFFDENFTFEKFLANVNIVATEPRGRFCSFIKDLRKIRKREKEIIKGIRVKLADHVLDKLGMKKPGVFFMMHSRENQSFLIEDLFDLSYSLVDHKLLESCNSFLSYKIGVNSASCGIQLASSQSEEPGNNLEDRLTEAIDLLNSGMRSLERENHDLRDKLSGLEASNNKLKSQVSLLIKFKNEVVSNSTRLSEESRQSKRSRPETASPNISINIVEMEQEALVVNPESTSSNRNVFLADAEQNNEVLRGQTDIVVDLAVPTVVSAQQTSSSSLFCSKANFSTVPNIKFSSSKSGNLFQPFTQTKPSGDKVLNKVWNHNSNLFAGIVSKFPSFTNTIGSSNSTSGNHKKGLVNFSNSNAKYGSHPNTKQGHSVKSIRYTDSNQASGKMNPRNPVNQTMHKNQSGKSHKNVIIGSKYSELYRAAPRPIHFYTGRWAVDVSDAMVSNYVKEFIQGDLSVCMLNTTHNRFKSFKLTVDQKNIKAMYTGSNWPEGIRVKRFFESRNPLKSSETAVSCGNEISDSL